MFDDWCEIEEVSESDRKTLYLLDERENGRDAVQDHLIEQVRCHYDDLQQIEEDIKRLGFPGASAILRERLPTTPRARSGEMGEILATEFIEFQTDFRIPVRRLRYKDGRDMALRGDDFLGINSNDERLSLLKGEAKSGQKVSNGVVEDAREKLSAEDGRPTAISLLFVADRLLEEEGDDRELGRLIRDEIALGEVPPQRITHGLFTLWANIADKALEDDLDAADGAHTHISVGFQIHDHRDFIAEIYEEAGNFGDD